MLCGSVRPANLYPFATTRELAAMLNMRKQTIKSECEVPALRKPLRCRYWLLSVTLLAVTAAVVDSVRTPDHEVPARLYVGAVHVYQAVARPFLNGRIQCRYYPSCSEYSSEAVEQYGLWKGLGLTISRLYRCRMSVPLGTYDPVPRGNGDSDETQCLCQREQPAR